MPHYRLALIGFGNVGQALARLLLRKKDELDRTHGITFSVTGIATGRHGMAIDPDGINLDQALLLARDGKQLNQLSILPVPASVIEFIHACPADVLFENSPVNHHTGQPAIDHLRTALEQGMHGITANKGPVVYGYQALTRLAAAHRRRFMFESAVMDGAPIFSLFRAALPGASLLGFRGILNSCTNLILTRMESGETFDQAVAYAQSIGITETDPNADVDGWDAAIKVAALVTVLMGIPMTLQQVERHSIRSISPAQISAARQSAQRWKLVCSARQNKDGTVQARVAPELVSADSPLYSINGTSSYVQFELDVLPGLGIVESDPGPETTAYGLLADLINAVKT
jgi:homoserine dehydrogenase